MSLLFVVRRLLLPFVLLLFCCRVLSYDNGVGKLPAMGWNSWNQFGCSVSEDLILDTAKGLKRYGLDKLGFQYVNIDDCWQLADRDKHGHVVPNPKTFPRGIRFLADALHSQGLKLGIYTDLGLHTCQKRAGSYGYFAEDAETYASWEIDYVKVDFCYATQEEQTNPWTFYGNFSNAFNSTGRHIVYSMCNGGQRDPWKWGPAISNSWRTTHDIQPTYDSMLSNMERNRVLAEYAGLYNYNDPDMLEVGVVRGSEKLSQQESRAHFSLWCMMAAPLLLGNDLRNISSDVLEIITNEEVISVSQDEYGRQGLMMVEDTHGLVNHECTLHVPDHCSWIQKWKKELVNGMIAALLFNHADSHSVSSQFQEETIEVTWAELGLSPSQSYHVRDLWNRKDFGVVKGSFTYPLKIEQHDVALLLLTPIST